MFIKYGIEEHLYSFAEKGDMYFNLAKKFREIEDTQKTKGQGDKHDSGLHSICNTVIMQNHCGDVVTAHNIDVSVLMNRAKDTPVFCLKSAVSESISEADYTEMRQQFPDYTHALIIEDEHSFLENIRYSFKSRAFGHAVFYQDCYTVDFCDFLQSGNSDIRFYTPTKKKNRYYARIINTDMSGQPTKSFTIDDSNYYKTMFRKDTFFRNQQEYRIVLPYKKIESGKCLPIQPFSARIVPIHALVQGE